MNCKECDSIYEPMHVGVLICSVNGNPIIGHEYLCMDNIPAPDDCPKRKLKYSTNTDLCEYQISLNSYMGKPLGITACYKELTQQKPKETNEDYGLCKHSSDNHCNNFVARSIVTNDETEVERND